MLSSSQTWRPRIFAVAINAAMRGVYDAAKRGILIWERNGPTSQAPAARQPRYYFVLNPLKIDLRHVLYEYSTGDYTSTHE